MVSVIGALGVAAGAALVGGKVRTITSGSAPVAGCCFCFVPSGFCGSLNLAEDFSGAGAGGLARAGA